MEKCSPKWNDNRNNIMQYTEKYNLEESYFAHFKTWSCHRFRRYDQTTLYKMHFAFSYCLQKVIRVRERSLS